MEKETLIQVVHLYRYYGQTCAVHDVSFDLAKGEVLGFLGPNGAGKSTTMQMITGNLAPSAGQVRVRGIDPFQRSNMLELVVPAEGGGGAGDGAPPLPVDTGGSPPDIGAYGGPGAGAWDLDRDGYPAWWQPGPYDAATYPAAGWDCDDLDAAVGPAAGC